MELTPIILTLAITALICAGLCLAALHIALPGSWIEAATLLQTPDDARGDGPDGLGGGEILKHEKAST